MKTLVFGDCIRYSSLRIEALPKGARHLLCADCMEPLAVFEAQHYQMLLNWIAASHDSEVVVGPGHPFEPAAVAKYLSDFEKMTVRKHRCAKRE